MMEEVEGLPGPEASTGSSLELKVCPFCDLDAVYATKLQRRHFVFCTHCEIQGPWGTSQAEAVAAWNRRSPPEPEWRPVVGYEGRYEVSKEGEIRPVRPYRVGTWIDHGGYVRARLSNPRVAVRVHRVVAAAWVPNPDGKPWVHHRDNDPSNPRHDNLEWCTQAENIRHMDDQGRRARIWTGRRGPTAVLSDEAVAQIRARYAAGGASHVKLAAEFGTNKDTIGRIVRDESYRPTHWTPLPPPPAGKEG